MKKRTQGMNWIRKDKRLAIYLRDNLACVYCGDAVENGAKLSLDHLICYSVGGSNHEANLVTCCSRCNSVRSDAPLSEWLPRVAQYVNHGCTVKKLEKFIDSCTSKKLDRKAAKEMMAARSSWSAIFTGV